MRKRLAHDDGTQSIAPKPVDTQESECAVTLVSEPEERYLISTYEARLRERAANARYPELLFGPLANDAKPVYSCCRKNSGLVVRVVQHGSLLPLQKQQLTEFRFQQYVLWHWFDTKAVILQQIPTDPAFDSLPPTTLHACIGTKDGQILACFVMQSAGVYTHEQRVLRRLIRTIIPHTYRLGELNRPLFPAEWESFGPAVFASLPALHKTPLQRVIELNCLMRNQAIPDTLTAVAAIEAVYTIIQILIMPECDLHALVGCINQEARGLLAKLGIPILYASVAPVTHDNLPPYWSRSMNDSGRFWPFVVSPTDFLTNLAYVHHLNAVLESTPQEILQSAGKFRQAGHSISPTTVRPTWSPYPYVWSDDPFQRPSSPAASAADRTSALPEGLGDLVHRSRSPRQPIDVPGVTVAAHSEQITPTKESNGAYAGVNGSGSTV